VHHKRAIGEMLIRQRDRVSYTTLLQLSQDKLLSLTRLPPPKFEAFMEAADPRTQSRDQVRARVGKWLGEAPAARKGGKAGGKRQPDFLAALFAVAGSETVMDDDLRRKLAQSPARPLTTLINGLSLVGVAAEKYDLAEWVDPAEIEEAIDELDTTRTLLEDRLVRCNALARERSTADRTAIEPGT
jgi:hypothetical protein